VQYIAIQEFIPEEQRASDRCIWCGGHAPKNRAHIISRKLTTRARRCPVLRFSVCQDCNSACGRVEEWVLRHTPLSWIRFMRYLDSNRASNARTVPSYFFDNRLKEWIVFRLDSIRQEYTIPAQLFVREQAQLLMLTQSDQPAHEKELSQILTAARQGQYAIQDRLTLPEGFAPRLMLQQGHVVLICRSREATKLLDHALACHELNPEPAHRMQLENSGQKRHHFSWSPVNWARFCAKTAYETLCLFEGSSVCLSPPYSRVREFVRDGKCSEGRELIFDERGPMRDTDTPLPVHLDLTVGQNAPVPLTAVVGHCDAAMHSVLLHEVCGWVVSSISFAGFPPSVIVLAGPDAHLSDLYELIYDDQEETYHFLRLAYDRTKPVIPLPLKGNLAESIYTTYRLRPTPLA
jgi:hypothetical protein